MFRRGYVALTATPESFTILHTTHPRPKRGGVGRLNKMRTKPSDNVAWYDRGPVEWLPRPVRLTYSQLDQLRDWMMMETLHPNGGGAGATAAATGSNTVGKENHSKAFDEIRTLHREWSQHPLLPMLGDVEPKFPLNLFKQNNKAKKRFLVRWHKANTPQQWMWLPRPSTGISSAGSGGPGAGHEGLHRARTQDYPEYWRQQQLQHRRAPQLAASTTEGGAKAGGSEGEEE